MLTYSLPWLRTFSKWLHWASSWGPAPFFSLAQQTLQDVPTQVNESKFKQLGQALPTPNVYRTASGAPGHEYWQQQVDYNIQVTLDDENQRIDGEERILYKNNSPDELRYLWLQLDENVRALDSDSYESANPASMKAAVSVAFRASSL